MSPHKLRVGSLFTGIGGFDLAAERAGMEVVWQSEIDSHASRVLKHHWPEVPNYGDIHNMGVRRAQRSSHRRTGPADGTEHGNGNRPSRSDSPNAPKRTTDLPAVDVLTGGFPCQDYSVAGNRGGLAGDRGALWWEYHRVIARLRPTWVVGENVPGLLSSRDGADFETIVGSLTECGYGVAWAVLDAQYFGVAQRRRRVFIVGHSGGEPRPEVLALSEGLYGHPEPRRETGPVPAALTANGLGGGGPDDNLAQAGHLFAFDWQAGGDGTSSGAVNSDGSTPTLGTVGRLAFAQNQRDELRELEVASSVSAERWGNGTNQTLLASSIAVRGRGDGQEWELGEPGLANALRAGDGGSSRGNWMTDFAQVRRLTPLECERLQGFPDGWTDIEGNSDTQRYRQLGNAVAVPVVEWLLRRIADA